MSFMQCHFYIAVKALITLEGFNLGTTHEKKLEKCPRYYKRGFKQCGHHNAIFQLMKGPYHSKVTYSSKILIS